MVIYQIISCCFEILTFDIIIIVVAILIVVAVRDQDQVIFFCLGHNVYMKNAAYFPTFGRLQNI